MKKIKILEDELERKKNFIKLLELKITKLEKLVKIQEEIIVNLIS